MCLRNMKPTGEKEKAFENSKKFARDDPKATAINDKIMEFMALDEQPFSVVEDQGFCQLIAHLEPRCVLPSRRYFADVSLPALYDAVAKHIHSEIIGIGHERPDNYRLSLSVKKSLSCIPILNRT